MLLKIKVKERKTSAELILPKNPTYSGYTFKCWEDKNEKPIYNNVVLAEDTTLYAKWEKDESKKSNTKKEDQKKDKPKEVVYYCDSGYVLEGTKCTKTEKKISEIIYSCSSPYSLSIDDKCIDITKKTDLVKVCAEYKGYKGVIAQGSPLCFYHDIGPGSSYQECVSIHNSQEVGQYNGRCYEFKKMKDDNSNNLIISSCPEGYTEFRPSTSSNPVCGKSVNAKKTYACPSGYHLSGKNCLKTVTVDAKKK